MWEISTWTFFRERCQGSHEGVNEGGGFNEWTLDAEVDDPGQKRESDENGGRVGTHQPVVHKRDAQVTLNIIGKINGIRTVVKSQRCLIEL
ncbi:hypothetical protein TNCV_3950921 [Trichonephila clavipes]|nr:hypothetical protein TNCV_3950921 [Trichonephila clavipes]